jgi:hypothetical protein
MKSKLYMKAVFGVGLAGIFLIAATAAMGAEARQVIGGDLIYTASATGTTQNEAVFMAESQAVRMIMIECAIPHRDTKVFGYKLNPKGDKFVAEISIGLPMESCDEGRNASVSRKTELSNPLLLASQKVYEQALEGRTPAAKSQQAPTQQAMPQVSDYRIRVNYSPAFLQSYERYLNAKVDERERLRQQLLTSQ